MTSASLEIRQPSLWSSDAHLTPPGSSIPLYTVQTHRWSSRLTFFAPTPGSSEKTLPAAADPAFLGEATFRSFKSDMTLTLRGLTLTMRRQAVLSASYKFTSAAPGQQGAIFTWKRNRAMRTFDHVLEDPRGVAIARLFRDASCSWTRKMGTIEFASALDPYMRDEVVLTAMMLAFHFVRSRNNANGAVAAST